MKSIKTILLFVALAIFSTRCGTVIKKSDESGEVSKKFDDKMNASESWQDHMHALEKNLVDLYPLVLDPIEFNNQKNEKKMARL